MGIEEILEQMQENDIVVWDDGTDSWAVFPTEQEATDFAQELAWDEVRMMTRQELAELME